MDSKRNPTESQNSSQESLRNLVDNGEKHSDESENVNENANSEQEDKESSIEYQKYLMRLQEEEDSVEKGTVYLDQPRYITLEICEASEPFERPFIEMALSKEKRADVVSVEHQEEEDNDDIVVLKVTKPTPPPAQTKPRTPREVAPKPSKPRLSLVRVNGDDEYTERSTRNRAKRIRNAVDELFRDSQHSRAIKTQEYSHPPPVRSVRRLTQLGDEIKVKPPQMEISDDDDIPAAPVKNEITTITLKKGEKYSNSEKHSYEFQIKSGQCAFKIKTINEKYKTYAFNNDSVGSKLSNQKVKITGLSDEPAIFDVVLKTT